MKINPVYVVRKVFGKTILVPYAETKIGNQPIYFNQTGCKILEMLEQSANEQELCDCVANCYSIEKDTDEYGQIQEFIRNLMEMAVIFV